MITAIDTNVILDICLPDPVYGERSAEKLKEQLAKGALVICEIVYAELSCNFSNESELQSFLRTVGIVLEHSKPDTLWRSAQIWKSTHQKGKKLKRILPDFLVGGHALCQADALLTRDRGFYRKYFKSLNVLST